MADDRELLIDLRDAVNDGKLGAFYGCHVEVYLDDQEDTGPGWFRIRIDGHPYVITLTKERPDGV